MTIINKEFIRKWHPRYDELVTDQNEYKLLADIVALNYKKNKTLTKTVFIKIIRWKSPRILHLFENRDYTEYKKGLTNALLADDNDKLPILDDLFGIGAPVASTILHFIYPDDFPIIDFRTAETLYYCNLISSHTVSKNRYPEFRQAILKLRLKTGYSLREIDRALFAYHKIELSKLLKVDMQKTSSNYNSCRSIKSNRFS